MTVQPIRPSNPDKMAPPMDEVRATKAKNLLSSITALSFSDRDEEPLSDELYQAETTHLQHVLAQHQVFQFVVNGNALQKFYNTMIQQTKDSATLRQEVAMQFLAVAVEGSAMEALEERVPNLLDVVYHALKHQHVSVCVPALHILTHLMFNLAHATTETRRLVVDQLGRAVPVVLHHLGEVDLNASTAPFFIASYEALYVGCKSVSTTFRPFASKIESACLPILSPPTGTSTEVASSVVLAMSNCLGAIALATDSTTNTWQQMVERVVLTLHYQLDVLSGKDKASDGRARPASLKLWLKDSVMMTLPLFLQADRLVYKVHALTSMLSGLLSSTAIAEKDIVLVAPDVLALLRRAFSIRADAVGKQSAISEDGRQLPSSVLYGSLPLLQPHFTLLLSSLVNAGRMPIFRFASSVAKVVQLSCHATVLAAVPALHAALQQVISTLGGGAYTIVGAPVLSWALGQLEHLTGSVTAPVQPAKVTAVVHQGNKKKRQRVAADAPVEVKRSTPTIHQIHQTRMTTNAALNTVATVLNVCGSWVPASDRIKISAIVHASQQDASLDGTVVTKVSLANVVVPDAQGTRGLALAQNMQFWARRTSGPWREAAMNVGECILHPRAPPMALAAAGASEVKAPASGTSSYALAQQAKRLEAEMDWENEESNTNDEETEAAQLAKKVKVHDAVAVAEVGDEDDMDDEKPVLADELESATEVAEDDLNEAVASAEHDDVLHEEPATEAAAESEDIGDDDDGDDFPDIVVDDE
ncbi:hypothetical protein H310_01904 [Aphanomyces invadans]|uniref:Pre-rRNA-processing protein RIX1 N-terminal domain-containing protein n=1 Tax=Aphanomyces invadans TaxID=157072 RepID=A0A024UM48_9STRA|nr:hypothetical protein H310_01904 [Aphanomyces invadans]ETW07369.1 hypothetical protein H310_01904 [Aphanomyces invadans]|eukprot:XP_008863462.1 hypothetical protein H310_01904 [Aphanomyces invadans]